ncbi:NAD(P)/FAD-dependent oxidoreductase [Roseobacteraceae bacterium S113]
MAMEFTAIRTPVHTGPAAWGAILPPRQSRPPLAAQDTADLVIIGAGFAGLAAARRALEIMPDARIALLDAGAIGEAASGRNSGFMIDLPHELTSEDYAGQGPSQDSEIISRNRLAIAFARRAVDDYGIATEFFDPAGKINGAATAQSHSANLSYAAHLADLGETHDMLDATQMQEITGSRYYHSGLYTPGTVMLQPAGFVRALADGLSQTVSLYENSPVTRIAKTGPDWRVETPSGALTAPRVILANNGHIESFGFKKQRLMHVFLFAAMSPVLSPEECAALGGAARWGITPSDPMGTTVRRIDAGQGGDRIIVRSCAEFRPDMQASAGKLASATRVLQSKFNDRFPQLTGMAMEHVWAGHLCLSNNGVAVSGELEPGLFAGCCQNGLGTTRGTLTGMAAAEAALGQSTELTAYFGAEAEPTRLPPPPLSTIGANAVLRWKEFKARKE